MTSREKRLALLSGLMALTVLSCIDSGWVEGDFIRQALLPPPALPALPLPPMQPTNLPPLPPSPASRAGEEGGAGVPATQYWVKHHGYLMKPVGMQCGKAALEPMLYVPDRHNDGLAVHYRDAGDRWIFDIAATYPSENAKVEAVVTVGCNAKREAAHLSRTESARHQAGPERPGSVRR